VAWAPRKHLGVLVLAVVLVRLRARVVCQTQRQKVAQHKSHVVRVVQANRGQHGAVMTGSQAGLLRMSLGWVL
jgi:hypothetical protein